MAGVTRTMKMPAVIGMAAMTTLTRMAPMAIVVVMVMAATVMMIIVIILMFANIVMLFEILHFVLQKVPEESTTNRT